MTRPIKIYTLPDSTTTQDIDFYIAGWQAIAQPIEDALNIKLMYYDPEFIFTSGNPQRPGIKTVQLPTWFVKALSEYLSVQQTALSVER